MASTNVSANTSANIRRSIRTKTCASVRYLSPMIRQTDFAAELHGRRRPACSSADDSHVEGNRTDGDAGSCNGACDSGVGSNGSDDHRWPLAWPGRPERSSWSGLQLSLGCSTLLTVVIRLISTGRISIYQFSCQ